MPDSYHDYARITGDAIDPVSGLVAWYPLDTGSGTTAFDESGNNNDGSIVGASWQGAGKTGGESLNFDGTDDYMTIPDQSYLRASNIGSMTQIVWCKTALNSDGYVWLKNGTGNEEWSIRVNSNGDAFIGRENDNDDGFYATGGNLTANDWVMLVNWFDGSTVRAYKNDAVQIGSDISFTGTLPSTTQDPNVGRHEAPKIYFNGLIDELRLYDTALTESEISQIYNSTV